MTAPQKPMSVRALGTRRLTQATVGIVVASVGGVAVLAIHDSELSHASTAVTQSTSTQTATDSGTGSRRDDVANNLSNSSGVVATQSAPQATSGGS